MSTQIRKYLQDSNVEEAFIPFFGKSTCLNASLKCLYNNTCSVGSKQEELEVCV